MGIATKDDTQVIDLRGLDRPLGERRAPPPPVRPARVRTAAQSAVLAIPVAIVLVAGWAHRTVVEDGFIYLRVVQQVRAGNGPVFTAGERVEAATGTLWVGVLSLADLLTPVRLEWLAVGLGLGCTAGGVWLATVGARRLWGDRGGSSWFLPLGSLVFVAVLPVWEFATSGLETGLGFGWLGLSLYLLACWASEPGRRLRLPAATVLGLGWLIRPELVLFSAAFLVLVVVGQWSRDDWGRRLRLVIAMVALPLTYQLFRMGFYGSLVPNTAIAKEGNRMLWDRGWRYLGNFADPYWLWVPALALVAGGYVPLARSLRRARLSRAQGVLAVFLGVGVAQMLYMVAVGGDHTHARLLLPGFFAVSAPVAAVPGAASAAGLLAVPWAVAALLVLRPPALGEFIVLPEHGFVTIDDVGWGADGPSLAWFQDPEGYYYEQANSFVGYRAGNPELDESVSLPYGAFAGVGQAGYAPGPDFAVLDLFGLADSFTAHLEIDSDIPAYPGHEKPLPAPWIAARLTPPGSRPAPENFPNWLREPYVDGPEWQEQVAWARAALECDEISDLLRSTQAPMTPSRFLRNVAGSLDNHQLRIPTDPEAAYHRFCGPGTPPEVLEVRDG